MATPRKEQTVQEMADLLGSAKSVVLTD